MNRVIINYGSYANAKDYYIEVEVFNADIAHYLTFMDSNLSKIYDILEILKNMPVERIVVNNNLMQSEDTKEFASIIDLDIHGKIAAAATRSMQKSERDMAKWTDKLAKEIKDEEG